MKVIPALILLAFSSAASASGFQLTEQNASGLGNAYAGQAAVAENASTIFFNPAGMTQLQDREFSLGLAAIGPSFHFHDKGSSVGALAGSGEGGNAGGWAALPNGYLSWALSKDLYVGVGVGAPFGLKTEYDNPWVGAAQSTMFDITTYNVNPSIAYRVNDQVSLGFGVNWQHVEATYDRQLGVTTLGSGASTIPGSIAVASPLRLTLDDDAWGWNAGALFTLSPATKIGVSYRSTIEYHTTGKIAVTGPNSTVNAATSSGARADIKMPDTFSLAVTQQLNDRWQMLGDLTWTGWSSIPRVDIYRTSGAGNGTIAQVLDTEFRDTWRVGVGATYKYDEAWKLKYGLAYDQTPVKGASTRLVSMPDNDRVWFSFGAQWAASKTSKLDMGISYIYIRDSEVNNNQTSQGRGTVTGDYSGNIWILGAQYSMAF